MTPGPFSKPPRPEPSLRRALARAATRLAAAEATGADTRAPALELIACLGEGGDAIGEAVAAWAEAEGLSALIGPALRRLLSGSLPDSLPGALAGTLVRALDDTARRVAERATLLAAERALLASALRAAGAQWRPLKGAWLADHAYRDPSDRPMADTDIWVPPERALAAHAAITALGYLCRGTTWKHSVYAMLGDRVVDRRGEHPGNPRPIDVHPRWLEGFRGIELDFGALPSTVRPGSTESWPDPGAMLAHVAAHATVDALGRRLRLLALVDVAVVAAEASGPTWQRVVELAASPHVARFVWPSLELARRELAAPVPSEVLRALGSHVRTPLRRWVAGVQLDDVTRPGGATAPRALLEIPRLWPIGARERITVARWIVWPPRRALADRYPALMASRGWPLAYARHVADTLGVARRRWRQRAGVR